MPRTPPSRAALGVGIVLVLAGCAQPEGRAPADAARPAAPAAVAAAAALPAGAAEAQARLAASPRHAEWAMIPTRGADSVRAWIVYPERPDRAPVVLVVHEIFGLSHWIRAVADQLAAEGFLAIAPDLLTRFAIPAGADGAPDADSARTAIRALQSADIHRQLRAVAEYGMRLPAALPRYGIVGYCWGGTVAFQHAAEGSDALGAAVVFYGASPDEATLARVHAPVLGLYGENDARVNATIPAAESALRARAQPFEAHLFTGAGHGFLRAQDGQGGANLAATREAWPLAVQWLRRHLAP